MSVEDTKLLNACSISSTVDNTTIEALLKKGANPKEELLSTMLLAKEIK